VNHYFLSMAFMNCRERELPSTARHWIDENNIAIEIFSDPTLTVSNALVGSIDLGPFVWEKQRVHLGSILVPSPSIVIIGSDGLIVHKKSFSAPGELLRAFTVPMVLMRDCQMRWTWEVTRSCPWS
jgi:hypothetical protein